MSHSHTPPRKRACLHCGNNPVNHFSFWYSNTMTVAALPISRLFSIVEHASVKRGVHHIFIPYIHLFRVVGLLRFSHDETRACSERSLVIWEEASRRGIQMEQCVFAGRPIERYRAKLARGWHYFDSLPIPFEADTSAYTWIDDKAELKKVLAKADVPVPQGGSASTIAHALAIFERVQKPVICKPEVGSRGRHTTTHLYTVEDLKKGFAIAKQLCHFVVVEEHLVGSVYRGTYVNGEIVGILRGDPPRVTGDGVSTIASLIEKKNAKKHERVRAYVITENTHAFLARQGYTVETVLPEGLQIDVLEKVGLSYGGYTIEEISQTHPKILAALKKAGDILKAPLIGFDFIIADITKDPDEQKWGIIEANSLPFIELHHFPIEGTPVNVAAKVWDMWR